MSMAAVHECVCMTTVLKKILPLYNTSSADTVECLARFYAATQGRFVGAFALVHFLREIKNKVNWKIKKILFFFSIIVSLVTKFNTYLQDCWTSWTRWYWHAMVLDLVLEIINQLSTNYIKHCKFMVGLTIKSTAIRYY